MKSATKLNLFGNQESLGVSSAPQVTRAQCEAGCDHSDKWKSCVQKVSKKGGANAYAVCNSSVGESSRLSFSGRLTEANELTGEPSGRRFRVTLLREGLGNLQDCYYYTASAIQSAAPVFEGKKLFLNHPSRSEEMDQPERSVKDVSGYYENLSVEQDPDGRFRLTGDLVMPMDDSFNRERALMLESLDYSTKHPDQALIGLSINADGSSSSIGIQEFMTGTQVPESCKPKLLEALQRGITTIHPVQEITSAISCDLVTEAGAGGSIDKLLEQEKSEMKKETETKKESEEKKEGAAPADQGGAPQAKADGSADSEGDEPGADGDADLILKMLDKYLGAPQHDEDTMEAAKEAMSNAMEATGGDQDKAMEMAGNVMAMHKHMQKKEKGEPQGVDPSKVPPQSQGSAPAPQEKKEGVKESAKGDSNKLIALTAENARLKAELEEIKLEKFVEKTLRESGLPMAATKKFRECIKTAKTEKEVTEKFTVFKEAYSIGGEADGLGFIFSAEKETKGAQSGLSFSDCVVE